MFYRWRFRYRSASKSIYISMSLNESKCGSFVISGSFWVIYPMAITMGHGERASVPACEAAWSSPWVPLDRDHPFDRSPQQTPCSIADSDRPPGPPTQSQFVLARAKAFLGKASCFLIGLSRKYQALKFVQYQIRSA